MSDPKSVTQWIVDLKRGDETAAAQLWERYFERMVRAARKKLAGRVHGAADAEDAAISAFDSLCRGAAEGRFERLTDRNDLWPLLLTLTAQKSVDLLRRESRQRRGGGAVLRESELSTAAGVRTIDRILSHGPTPEFLVVMEEEYHRLLARLSDETLRAIVRWKLEGHTNANISQFLGVSVHTVGRKLRMIRLTWAQELQ